MKTRVWILLALTGCALGAENDGAFDDELPGGAVTQWTDSTELFMEHPALIVGRPAKLAVHLTDLTDFAPLRSGTVTFRFQPRDGDEPVVVVQNGPRLPGIYGPTAEFGRPGDYDLVILVESPQARDSILVEGLRVFDAAGEVPAAAEAPGGEIGFLKEQQWKTPGFRTAFALPGRLAGRFEATGVISPGAGRLAQVVAPVGGLVDLDAATRAPPVGRWVERGAVLAVITPALGESGSAVAQARAELRNAEDEYQRAMRLYAAEAISQRRLREAEIRLQAAREAMAGLAGGGGTSGGRLDLQAPIAGVIGERQLVAGSRVEAGTVLFTVVNPSLVWLKVNVPVEAAPRVDRSAPATFRLEGSERLFRAARVVSVGSVMDPLTRTVPVLYEVANADRAIPIGANARVSVPTGERADGVLIPASAVLDEDGRPIAYVQTAGEAFEKRTLTVGASDGERVLVVAGLAPGERVVTGAVYQVRLASLSTSVPAEGHEH